jgi:3'-phosphoadenosine 5'-phosphosulfate (PAPS) 3'-phosphatase
MPSQLTHMPSPVLCHAVPCCAELGQSPGGAEGRHWVLDPIDGTRGFVGMRQYAVCLGMLQEGEVVLGVLGCPNLPQAVVRDDDGGAGERGLDLLCVDHTR